MKIHQKNNQGFTLLELVVVIAIIGILGAIGVPAYQGYVTKAKESKAQNTLQSIHMMEKNYFSENFCYFKTVSTGDEGLNINTSLFKSSIPSKGPIEIGSSNDFYFYTNNGHDDDVIIEPKSWMPLPEILQIKITKVNKND